MDSCRDLTLGLVDQQTSEKGHEEVNHQDMADNRSLLEIGSISVRGLACCYSEYVLRIQLTSMTKRYSLSLKKNSQGAAGPLRPGPRTGRDG